MKWRISDKGDPAAVSIADRHYNRQRPGSPQCMPPGRTLVLVVDGLAVWGSLGQVDARHEWPGAWVCSLFRNEGGPRSSELIVEAVAATRWAWGEPPAVERVRRPGAVIVEGRVRYAGPVGMISFVQASKIRSSNPGCCYREAGWDRIGMTEGGHGREPLHVFGLRPERFPEACAPNGTQLSFAM